MRHRKSSIVYTCNNRIYKPGKLTLRDLAFAKSLINLLKSLCLRISYSMLIKVKCLSLSLAIVVLSLFLMNFNLLNDLSPE